MLPLPGKIPYQNRSDKMTATANPPGEFPPPIAFQKACEDITAALDRMYESDDSAGIAAAAAAARAGIDAAAAACRRR